MSPVWRMLGEPGGGMSVAERIRAARGLDPRLEMHHDPFLMKGMSEAVTRIQRALKDGERILIFGDYDADGVTSAALLAEGLESLGGRVGVRLPHRVEEGYGLQTSQIREILDSDVDLLITVDNGTTAVEQLGLAAREGLDVIVADHHSPTGELPPVTALLNPRQAGCDYPFKSLAAVGVCWKLLQALEWQHLDRGLDLAALGTVADLATLKGENRLLVKRGLQSIRRGGRPGLDTLLELPGVSPRGDVDSRTLGWQLGPRINCAGRMADPDLAYRLLRAATHAEALPLAQRLDAMNQERRRVQDEAVHQAEQALSGVEEIPAVLVFVGQDWHLGVIGLIAGRLAQLYERPVIVLSRVLGDGRIKGSARSVPGLHITEAIASQRHLLLDFGGHAEAAGLTLLEENLRAFMDGIDEDMAIRAEGLVRGVLDIDSLVTPEELKPSLVAELASLEPFGSGNPPPRLGMLELRVERLFSLSQGKHLKLWLTRDGQRLEAVWWNHGSEQEHFPYGMLVDLVFEPRLNEWNGRVELQLHVEAMRSSESGGV